MKRKRSPKEIRAFRCPTCGAAPKEKCELNTGQPRTNAHCERRLIAADAPIEMASGGRLDVGRMANLAVSYQTVRLQSQ